ncbi:hypothetical protein CJF42_24315, partial [Pseudoalteromonas sp. NBT06-2]|uniref:hypothetical protein n=1 Tax=Pseudoalteromonas sp. NBT06-2 TaxID=2025950 RepID=UPI000BD01A58
MTQLSERYIVKNNVCKADFLTVVFCPDEVARLKMNAKLHLGNGDFKTYNEAYNALICSDVFNEDATDDLDYEEKNTVYKVNHLADEYYDSLFKNNLAEKYNEGDCLKTFHKSIVRRTAKYKALTQLIEGDLHYFMRLLNEEVATRADRYMEDEQPWQYRERPAGLFTYEKSATLYRHGVDSGR